MSIKILNKGQWVAGARHQMVNSAGFNYSFLVSKLKLIMTSTNDDAFILDIVCHPDFITNYILPGLELNPRIN